MEHCPHHTDTAVPSWTAAIFTRQVYLLTGLSPVFTEEDGGHHGEAGGQEGEAGEHCGHCGEDGDGHNLPEAAATLAVKVCALLWKLFFGIIFFETPTFRYTRSTDQTCPRSLHSFR